jgi:cellulose synthase/poly-beta-1,6-N-acetylglucosamine synthase-like glycosyltransferase
VAALRAPFDPWPGFGPDLPSGRSGAAAGIPLGEPFRLASTAHGFACAAGAYPSRLRGVFLRQYSSSALLAQRCLARPRADGPGSNGALIDAIIPALDEERTIGVVVRSLPRPPLREIVVVDNGSRDATARVAAAAGARVVAEPRRGYGAACLRGIEALYADAEIVVFLDGDGADDPADLDDLLAPLLEGRADLVVGSRARGARETGALAPAQRIGNAIACAWLRARFGIAATDLGPFRAIRADALRRLGMRDRGYGWTLEMQLRAGRKGLRVVEVPVRYRRRAAGSSKVSGTVAGTLGAATKILGRLLLDSLRSAAKA